MDTLKELLFERPATIYVLLAAVEVVVLAVWAWRRTARCGWAALAAPVLAVVVGLIAHYVETDREQITSILRRAIADIEAGRVDSAAECLDEEFAAPGRQGRAIAKNMYVELARRTLSRWPVEKVYVRRLEIEVTGGSAVTELDTTIVGRSGEGIEKATWRVEWTRRPMGWRVMAIRALAPPELVRLTTLR